MQRTPDERPTNNREGVCEVSFANKAADDP